MFEKENISTFSFLLNTKTTVGNGQVRNLSTPITNYGFKYPLVLVDEGFEKSPVWQECKNGLEKKFNSSLNIFEISGKVEPNYSDLRKMRSHFPNWDITKSLTTTIEEIYQAWLYRKN